MSPECLANLVGAQTLLEGVSMATVEDTETSLRPGGGSCVTTATSLTGMTGERECHTGARGMREEAQQGGEEVGPGHEHAVVMT